MSTVIHKFTFSLTHDVSTFEIPAAAPVRHIESQFNKLCMWVELDPFAPKIVRTFEIYGAGHNIPEGRFYVGTAQLLGGDLVLHIYEVGK